MPKSKEYLSSDSSSESDTEVKDNKRKKESKEKPEPKKAKKETKPKNEENEWDLGEKRYAVVKEFKGKLYVDLREKYMDKDTAEMKFGKKGMCLSMSQWKKLQEHIDEINEAISKK